MEKVGLLFGGQDYKFKEILSSGAFGFVAAFNSQGSADVVVKIMLEPQSAAKAKLGDKAIPTLDRTLTCTTCFMRTVPIHGGMAQVMERMDGNLDEYIIKMLRGRKPYSDVDDTLVAIGMIVYDQLDTLRVRGHRYLDMKLENVLYKTMKNGTTQFHIGDLDSIDTDISTFKMYHNTNDAEWILWAIYILCIDMVRCHEGIYNRSVNELLTHRVTDDRKWLEKVRETRRKSKDYIE